MTKGESLARFGGCTAMGPQRRPCLIPKRQSAQVLVIALESLRLTQRGGNGHPCHLPSTLSLIADGFLDRILKAADRILKLTGGLLHLAFGFEFGIAGHFSDDFLDLAFSLFDGTLDSIFVYVFVPRLVLRPLPISL